MVRNTPAPDFARASIDAIPNANSTCSGTMIAISQSVFLIAVQICGSTVNR
jgi:hypothetical protein